MSCSWAVFRLWQGWRWGAVGQPQRAEESEGATECLGPSSHSSHMIFLPIMFSGPSPWAPESEASRTITSLSLYTNSCIFLLLFTADGASPSILPAPRGLVAGFMFAWLIWESKNSIVHRWGASRWGPQLLGLLLNFLLHFSTSLDLRLSSMSLIPCTYKHTAG